MLKRHKLSIFHKKKYFNRFSHNVGVIFFNIFIFKSIIQSINSKSVPSFVYNLLEFTALEVSYLIKIYLKLVHTKEIRSESPAIKFNSTNFFLILNKNFELPCSL